MNTDDEESRENLEEVRLTMEELKTEMGIYKREIKSKDGVLTKMNNAIE